MEKVLKLVADGIFISEHLFFFNGTAYLGNPLTPATDIYGVNVTLYKWITYTSQQSQKDKIVCFIALLTIIIN